MADAGPTWRSIAMCYNGSRNPSEQYSRCSTEHGLGDVDFGSGVVKEVQSRCYNLPRKGLGIINEKLVPFIWDGTSFSFYTW